MRQKLPIAASLAAPLLSRDEIEAYYRKHAHSVLRRARRLLGSEQEAREILQEVFLSLLERPAQFRGNSSLLTWLYAAVTHACLNRLRNGTAQARLLKVFPTAAAVPSLQCPPDHEVELRRLLRRLPIELAHVAVYYYSDTLSYDEIADLVGCSRRKIGYLLEQLRAVAKNEGIGYD